MQGLLVRLVKKLTFEMKYALALVGRHSEPWRMLHLNCQSWHNSTVSCQVGCSDGCLHNLGANLE
jgi:hypothetical protein